MTENLGKSLQTIRVPFPNERWFNPVFAQFAFKYMNKNILKPWKKRFFLLTRDGKLWIFHDKTSPEPTKKEPVEIRGKLFWSVEKKKNFCIQIERSPEFIISFEERSQFNEWMKMLSNVGGIERIKGIKNWKNSDGPQISQINVENWSTEMVQEWLEYVYLEIESETQERMSIYSEVFKETNGNHLIDPKKVNEKFLRDGGISSMKHRKKILRTITELRNRKRFNYSEYVVLQKIQEMTGSSSTDSGNWYELARALSDPKEMVKTYLNPDILEDSLDKMIGSEDQGGEEEEEEEFNDSEVFGEVVDGQEQSFFKFKKDRNTCQSVPFKLVVTEIVQKSKYKKARKLLSPVLNKLPKYASTFGIFHTALVIGPWYIEWNSSGMCIPRHLYSGMALISADIEVEKVLQEYSYQQLTQKLSKLICYWNVNKVYKQTSAPEESKFGNCQDFVECVMKEIGVGMVREGAFGRFLENMKKKGQCDMEFCPTEEFKKRFEIKLDRIRFDSHYELDEFCDQLAEKDPIALELDYRDVVKLLKSFDRAFWLRHFKSPKTSRFKPRDNKCFFGDPRSTKSYMVYK